MDKKQIIHMTKKELNKYEIIKNLIDGKIDGTEASKQIGVSVRQIRRLKSATAQFGAQGIAHGNRGKDSNRKFPVKIMKKIEKYLKEKYYDFGPTFASEKLKEKDGIKINKETLRIKMNELGLWKIRTKKQSKNIHVWRARKDNYGEMQQFDGSYHFWLEDRAEEMCLLASIDDATGKITHAHFDYNEGVKTVSSFWLNYFEKNGLPLSIYLDKFSTYKINHRNAVDNSEMITQFQRMMNQIGVKLITAHSPEAKGRIERLFETLQDRLVKEMRLAGIKTIDEANEFLKIYIPKFNEKFAVIPNKKTDLHKKINESLKEKLPQIFSVQSIRKVNNDYTIMFKNNYYQLNLSQPTSVYKKDAVIIEEHLSGEVKINLKNHYLNYFVLPEKPKKEINIKLSALTNQIQNSYVPPADHPWRKTFFKKSISSIQNTTQHINNLIK